MINPQLQLQSGSYWLKFKHQIGFAHQYLALSENHIRHPDDIIAYHPANLHATSNSADYLIISHADFITGVVPLAQYRSAQGLRVKIVEVQNIYNEFNDGEMSAEAIRDFLAYAYHNWSPPQPTYVLLVGDGVYDFKDYYNNGSRTFIPPFLAEVDPWQGETASENLFVAVSGGDILPDMYIGRLSVNSHLEVSAAVSNILAYEQNPDPGDWNSRLLFVADNADAAGNFPAYADEVVNDYTPANYTADKVYYKVTHTNLTQARQSIIDAINQGRLVVNYIGHASYKQWASEQLFMNSTVNALNNYGKLPLMAPMTCSDGAFHIPVIDGIDRSAIAENMTRAQGKGAIASFSPTGYGVASGHDYLHKGLYTALFYDGITQLGPATTQAKLYLYDNAPVHRDLVETYMLFGDPALRLHTLPADLAITKSVTPAGSVQAGDALTYTLRFINTGQALATHIVITDIMPSAITSATFQSSGAEITLRPGSNFVWDVHDLAPGETGVITISATTAPGQISQIINQAYISTAIRDANTDNNIASVSTYISLMRLFFPIASKNSLVP